jgi:hypothetical protein
MLTMGADSRQRKARRLPISLQGQRGCFARLTSSRKRLKRAAYPRAHWARRPTKRPCSCSRPNRTSGAERGRRCVPGLLPQRAVTVHPPTGAHGLTSTILLNRSEMAACCRLGTTRQMSSMRFFSYKAHGNTGSVVEFAATPQTDPTGALDTGQEGKDHVRGVACTIAIDQWLAKQTQPHPVLRQRVLPAG